MTSPNPLAPQESPEFYWQQAANLFQPALIRLLDQIRQQLDASDWKGTFESRELWPADLTPESLPASSPSETSETPETAPQILYLLHLSRQEQTAQVNIWELCYQICFQSYDPQLERETIADFQPGEVKTDISLFDPEGEIDWHQLDHKAHRVVAEMLAAISHSEISH
jgi:hypothetical protein